MIKSSTKIRKSPMKIMLADDDEADRILFVEALDSLNLSIDLIVIKTGKELIEYFNNSRNPYPDLIFLDLSMTYLNGLECLPIIRKIEGLQTVPIAIYSTSSSREDMQEALTKGANIYVKRPNEFTKLQEIIKKIMEINWQYRNSDFDSDTFVMSI